MASALKTAALALAILAAGCAGPAGDVSVLQSANLPIVPGATFAWTPIPPDQLRNGDPRIDNDIIRERIRTAVNSALTAKGYRIVADASAAQYLLAYHLGLSERTDYRVDQPSNVVCGWRGCVSGYGWGVYGAPTDVRSIHYVEGTLVLDLSDRASGQLAWRATSQRRIDQGDGAQERIDAVVTDLVKSLPGP